MNLNSAAPQIESYDDMDMLNTPAPVASDRSAWAMTAMQRDIDNVNQQDDIMFDEAWQRLDNFLEDPANQTELDKIMTEMFFNNTQQNNAVAIVEEGDGKEMEYEKIFEGQKRESRNNLGAIEIVAANSQILKQSKINILKNKPKRIMLAQRENNAVLPEARGSSHEPKFDEFVQDEVYSSSDSDREPTDSEVEEESEDELMDMINKNLDTDVVYQLVQLCEQAGVFIPHHLRCALQPEGRDIGLLEPPGPNSRPLPKLWPVLEGKYLL